MIILLTFFFVAAKESDRDLEILCTLRGSSHDPVRLRVRQWVQEYSKARGVNKFAAKEVNFASRTVVSTDYFQQMQRSQIIVTSNPSNWEGLPAAERTESNHF